MGLAVNVLGLMLLVSRYPGDCNDIGPLNIEVVITGNDIGISWTVNTTEQNIYGFKAVVYDDKKAALYTSSVIQSQEREMTISYELKGTCSVCIQALLNNTLVLQEACKEVTVNNLKMVIGILAGAIFLIPCILVLAYIIYKDRKASKFEHYEKLEESLDSEKTVNEDPASATGNVNVAYADETMQAKGVNKKAKEESITSERTDTKVPSLFKQSLSKDVVIGEETIKSGQDENIQLSSKTDLNTRRASNKNSLSTTTVSNDQGISQKKTEIYVVRL